MREETQNISRSTIYRYLRKEGVAVNGFKKTK
jgi:predicted DNA-binding transcriptional regulator AlpA